MQNEKKVKDIIADIFEYPHIPYWFSINQAIKIIKASFLNAKKYIDPMAILIFDEKYNLLGTVTIKDILKGFGPQFLNPVIGIQAPEEDETSLTIIWDTHFSKMSKELAEKPVSEIMIPAKIFIEPDESVTKAAYLMLRHDLSLLPVLENKKKLVGIVRMIEIFDEISNGLIENNNVLHSSKSEEKTT